MNYSEKLKNPNWISLKLKIQLRDENKCRKCNSEKNLNVHHLVYLPNLEPWQYEDDLLITLCSSCHLDTEALLERIKQLIIITQQQNIWRLDNFRVLLERDLSDENLKKYNSIKFKHG